MFVNQQFNSIQVYTQQLQQYFDQNISYEAIKKYLFTQLNTQSTDEEYESLGYHIYQLIQVNLQRQVRSQKILRVINLLYEILVYAQESIMPHIHNQAFILHLTNLATNVPLLSFNGAANLQYRQKIYCILTFVVDRYRERQEEFILFKAALYTINNKGLNYSNKYYLREQNTYRAEKTPSTLPIYLKEITAFTHEVEDSDIANISNTEYVRLIKNKSKYLYERAKEPAKLNEKEKSSINQLYKRLRTVLKKIDAFNKEKIQIKGNKKIENQNKNNIVQIDLLDLDSPVVITNGKIQQHNNIMFLNNPMQINISPSKDNNNSNSNNNNSNSNNGNSNSNNSKTHINDLDDNNSKNNVNNNNNNKYISPRSSEKISFSNQYSLVCSPKKEQTKFPSYQQIISPLQNKSNKQLDCSPFQKKSQFSSSDTGNDDNKESFWNKGIDAVKNIMYKQKQGLRSTQSLPQNQNSFQMEAPQPFCEQPHLNICNLDLQVQAQMNLQKNNIYSHAQVYSQPTHYSASSLSSAASQHKLQINNQSKQQIPQDQPQQQQQSKLLI